MRKLRIAVLCLVFISPLTGTPRAGPANPTAPMMPEPSPALPKQVMPGCFFPLTTICFEDCISITCDPDPSSGFRYCVNVQVDCHLYFPLEVHCWEVSVDDACE